MRHAYLILAHNEFEVLNLLIQSLDSASNDIYIHIDRRVKVLPQIKTKESKVHFIDARVKSFWGDVSLAEAELNMLAAATENGQYDYYHIISGTHFPLKKLSDIDAYYADKQGNNIMMPMDTCRAEIEMKMGKTHLFIHHLVDKKKWLRKIYHFCWLCVLHLQKKKVKDVSFVTGKASQWCSLTDEAAKAMVSSRELILKNYHRSFCCDEFFVRSFLELNKFPIAFDNNLCYIDFVNTAPRNLTEEDFPMLINGPYLFARKMSSSHMGLAKSLYEYIKN